MDLSTIDTDTEKLLNQIDTLIDELKIRRKSLNVSYNECTECHNVFTLDKRNPRKRMYCSDACKSRAYRKRIS